MRYYELHFPGMNKIIITTRVRGRKDLPKGTKIYAVVTDQDGSVIDTWEIPVVDGRAQVEGLAVKEPKCYGSRRTYDNRITAHTDHPGAGRGAGVGDRETEER